MKNLFRELAPLIVGVLCLLVILCFSIWLFFDSLNYMAKQPEVRKLNNKIEREYEEWVNN